MSTVINSSVPTPNGAKNIVPDSSPAAVRLPSASSVRQTADATSNQKDSAKVPICLIKLVRSIVRTFYSREHSLIVDMLANYLVPFSNQARNLLKTNFTSTIEFTSLLAECQVRYQEQFILLRVVNISATVSPFVSKKSSNDLYGKFVDLMNLSKLKNLW
ncbi:unnamed protein product [Schistosoma spindalis]|nr:unnamed protein product [Schistosoma spindale]